MKAKKVTKARARKVLKELVSIINKKGRASDSLRDIVTALRGPDATQNYNTKNMTTAVIRHQIGIVPESGLICNSYGDLDKMEAFLQHEFAHFIGHIRRAVTALKYLNIKAPKAPVKS